MILCCMMSELLKTTATYLAFGLIVISGHVADQLAKIIHYKKYRKYFKYNGLSPMFTTFESFYIRRLYRRISDCWNRPISTSPSVNMEIMRRVSKDENKTFLITGEKIKVLNFASYNYLGLADKQNFNTDEFIDQLIKNGDHLIASVPPILNDNARLLENKIAKFLYKEECVIFQMGYGTNTLNISLIMNDALILSDEKNHTSIINGLKITNGLVVIYKHNNFKDLEKKLKFHIAQGQPLTHRAWNKIFVVLEGLFSMEGSIPDLNKLILLKEKYKFYIYLDEAHSFGCLGKTGRGICELLDVNFDKIDIIMGTFTKTFNGYGGFIASTKNIIDFLRVKSPFLHFSDNISPVVVNQIVINLDYIIKHPEMLKELKEKTIYMRQKLKQRRFIVLGNKNSPVIPLLISNPGKLGEFSRLCLEKGLAMVVVGYPATPLLQARTRICMSAAHTYDEIDKAIKIIDLIGTLLGIKR